MILKLSIEPIRPKEAHSLGGSLIYANLLHILICFVTRRVLSMEVLRITTCSLSTDFIISVPDGADNEWKVSMYPTLKTYFFSDLFGFHDQYETLFDDAAESWIGIEKVFNLPTVDLKDE